MVYTDGIHLIADSVKELHEFANKIGLKKCWYENTRGVNRPHYDLYRGGAMRKTMFDVALVYGAIKVTSKQIVIILDFIYGERTRTQTEISLQPFMRI